MKKLFLSITLISLITGCTSSAKEAPDPESDQMLNVALLITEGVYNTELFAPIDMFQHTIFHVPKGKGMKVFLVAESTNPITTFEGQRVIPDYTFDDPNLPRIDILVVPSAEHSMDSDLDNEIMIDFITEKGNQADYVMSLCDGAFVLAKAGLVEGKESTTFPADIERYRNTYPHLKIHDNVSFVHDGKLITSAGGIKSYESSLYLVELIYGKKAADGVAKGLVIDWNLSEIPHIMVNELEIKSQ